MAKKKIETPERAAVETAALRPVDRVAMVSRRADGTADQSDDYEVIGE